jgi:hypothetical protein
MMSDERFFNQVKATMAGYSPEVPTAVYGGMRRKLWLSNFTRFSITRLNVWYLALAVGAGALAATHFYSSESVASKPGEYNLRQDWSLIATGNLGSAESTGTDVSACATSCSAVKNSGCSASAHTSGADTPVAEFRQNVEPALGTVTASELAVANEATGSGAAQETPAATSSTANEPVNAVAAQDTPAQAKTAKRKTLSVSVYKDKEAEAAEKK